MICQNSKRHQKASERTVWGNLQESNEISLVPFQILIPNLEFSPTDKNVSVVFLTSFPLEIPPNPLIKCSLKGINDGINKNKENGVLEMNTQVREQMDNLLFAGILLALTVYFGCSEN